MRQLFVVIAGLAAAGPMVAQVRLTDAPETFVVSRSVDSIRAEREQVSRSRGQSDGRAGTAEARQAEATLQVELLKQDLSALDDRLKAAKKAKRDAEKTVLESDKKILERRRDLWERRRDLRQAEFELFRSEVEYAEAAIKALDFEAELEGRRLDPGAGRLLEQLERKTLESRLEQENRRRNTDDRRIKIVERQLESQRAQLALAEQR